MRSVSGAAAVVLLGGVAAVLSGHPPGSSNSASVDPALVSATGCTALAQVNGTLEQLNGGDLVIRTPSGRLATVTTTAATRIAVSKAPLPATLAELQAGANTVAVGHTGPGKTMSAVAVFQPPVTPAGAHPSVTIGDCSPNAIDRAITALGSAG